jgi:hypothetical protein
MSEYVEGFNEAMHLVERLMIERLDNLKGRMKRHEKPKTSKQGDKARRVLAELTARVTELNVLAGYIQRSLQDLANQQEPSSKESEEKSDEQTDS